MLVPSSLVQFWYTCAMATYQERDGRIRAIIRRKGHPVKSKTFGRKSDAVKWARKVESDLDHGGFVESKESVKALMLRYRDEVSEKKRGWKWEQTRIDNIIKQPWSDMKASDCADELNDWAQRRRKEVSDATVNRELNILSGVFTHAMKFWRVKLTRNPVSIVVRPPNSKARNQRINQAMVDKFWNHDRGREHSIRWYVPIMVEFGIETALRLSEMCNLEWDHIHEDESWLHVVKSKNGDDRKVPMSPRAIELLKLVPKDTDNVFPIQEGSFGVIFRKVCKELRIVDLHFHDTRHEAVSRLARIYPVLQLAAISGHRNLKSLQVYYNPTIQELVQHMHGAAQPMLRHP